MRARTLGKLSAGGKVQAVRFGKEAMTRVERGEEALHPISHELDRLDPQRRSCLGINQS